jgi:hypothetical protein
MTRYEVSKAEGQDGQGRPRPASGARAALLADAEVDLPPETGYSAATTEMVRPRRPVLNCTTPGRVAKIV